MPYSLQVLRAVNGTPYTGTRGVVVIGVGVLLQDVTVGGVEWR